MAVTQTHVDIKHFLNPIKHSYYPTVQVMCSHCAFQVRDISFTVTNTELGGTHTLIQPASSLSGLSVGLRSTLRE